MQQMQQMHKTWAQKGVGGGEAAAPPFWGAAEGRPPSFVHLLHLLRCFYMLFACFAFVLHFIYILFASLLGMMRQLLRQWLLPRMLWMLLLLLLLLLCCLLLLLLQLLLLLPLLLLLLLVPLLLLLAARASTPIGVRGTENQYFLSSSVGRKTQGSGQCIG